jgi:hypothetical protein
MAIVTTPLAVATGAGVGSGVGLGVGGGCPITNSGEGVGRDAASVNLGEANTAMVPATSATIASRKRMIVRIVFSTSSLAWEVGVGLAGDLVPGLVFRF